VPVEEPSTASTADDLDGRRPPIRNSAAAPK
jgi:hypothetical protein